MSLRGKKDKVNLELDQMRSEKANDQFKYAFTVKRQKTEIHSDSVHTETEKSFDEASENLIDDPNGVQEPKKLS